MNREPRTSPIKKSPVGTKSWTLSENSYSRRAKTIWRKAKDTTAMTPVQYHINRGPNNRFSSYFDKNQANLNIVVSEV